MKKRISESLLASALILTLLSACGGSAGGNTMAAEPGAAAVNGDLRFGGASSSSWAESVAPQEAPSPYMDSDLAEYEELGGTAVQSIKMIRTASLDMETTAFDEALKGLDRLTGEMGGYFENTTIRTGGSGYRWADYTVRIPAERFDAFLEQAGELCHLTWRTTGQENITEVYYDTAGRLKTQQIKLERLQELLSRAERMEDIITIESAISETEYQIDSLSGALRHYDALVGYATVTINLQEVYRLSDVEEVPGSFAARIGSAFASGWRGFVSGMENLAVGLAYSWTWILVLALIALAAAGILRRRNRRTGSAVRKEDDKSPKA